MNIEDKKIYNSVVSYLESKSLPYNVNVIENVIVYRNYTEQGKTKKEVYEELKKYFNKRLCGVVLQIIKAINDDSNNVYDKWKDHLFAIKQFL